MAKAKLTAAMSKWVKRKGPREKVQTDNSKVRHTIYISKKASKLLWQHRVDTGIPVSRSVNDLITKYLDIKKP